MTDASIENLKRTTYRHIYAGWLKGRRINAVSAEAELCFLRLNLVCDGCGNFLADPDLVAVDAFPLRRDVTSEQCKRWIDELADRGLVSLYEAVGETYGHITGFEGIQPAGKNGRRHSLHPQHAGTPCGDDSGQGEPVDPSLVNPGESGCIPIDPVYPSAQNENENEKENKKQNENENEEGAPTGSEVDVPAPVDSGFDSVPISGSVSPTAGTEAAGGTLDRGKARARWMALIAKHRMIGRENGSNHPRGSKQHNADLTSINRLWDRVWPEEHTSCTDQIHRFNTLITITKTASTKRKPMAWITREIKIQIPEVQAC